MSLPGIGVFAHPSLTDEENGDVCAGDLKYCGVQLLHGRTEAMHKSPHARGVEGYRKVGRSYSTIIRSVKSELKKHIWIYGLTENRVQFECQVEKADVRAVPDSRLFSITYENLIPGVASIIRSGSRKISIKWQLAIRWEPTEPSKQRELVPRGRVPARNHGATQGFRWQKNWIARSLGC